MISAYLFSFALEMAGLTLSAEYVSVAVVVLAISLIGFARIRSMVSQSYGGRAVRGWFK